VEVATTEGYEVYESITIGFVVNGVSEDSARDCGQRRLAYEGMAARALCKQELLVAA
jgi:DNA-binding GntR family transcriptional regulator